MTKIIKIKALVSLALVVTAAFSLIGCTPEYGEARAPYMKLSTPPMVPATPPCAPQTDEVDYNTTCRLNSERAMKMRPIFNPMDQPTVIQGSPATDTGSETQMLGQPGSGPALMNSSSEVMPDMRMRTDDTYQPSR